jgi:hypothetical protein
MSKKEKEFTAVVNIFRLRGSADYKDYREFIRRYYSYGKLPILLLQHGLGKVVGNQVEFSKEPLHISKIEKCLYICRQQNYKLTEEECIKYLKNLGYKIFKEL